MIPWNNFLAVYSPRGGGEPHGVIEAIGVQQYSPRGGGKTVIVVVESFQIAYSPRCEGEPCALYTKWVIEKDILSKIN